MEMADFYALLALAGFYIYSLFQRRLSSTVFTLPLLMTAFGLAMAAPVDAALEQTVGDEFKKTLAELTLILVLFSDSSSIKFRRIRKIWSIPARMLIIGMPLSILLGTLITAFFLPEFGVLFALLIAAVLAPTDAALAQPVVKNEDLPPVLTETLNVESGLNDGLAVPFVFGAAILLAGSQIESPIQTIFVMLIIAPIIGGGVGFVTAKLMDWARARNLTGDASRSVVYFLTPFIAYLFSELLGGNGFIAAFVGGMAFGNVIKQPVVMISDFMESEGQILTMFSFFVFGAFILPDAFLLFEWSHLALAILFLTIIRMLPIYISLAGTGLSSANKLFLGWFGPRGLASILYVLLISDGYDIEHIDIFFSVVSLTVLMSIIFHGISATPLAQEFVKNRKGVQENADIKVRN